MPSVSVLLPVRDAGPYLDAALASLARQSLADLEIVAIDDGSTDGSGERLERAARREPRLRVIHRPAAGLAAALNAGLAAAQGRYVARQDADDFSRRRRLELQRGFLSEHPRIAVAGSRVRLFPASAVSAGMRRWQAWHNALLTHEEMAREALIDSPLCHATAFFRRDALERVGGWTDRRWPEDVDLWLRLLAAGARLGKLPAVLYAWRQHPGSATRRDIGRGRDRFDSLRLHALQSTLLQGARRVTVVGVGNSLERWRGRLESAGLATRPLVAGRPTADALSLLAAPTVLVFGALPARERWRSALAGTGWTEGRQFAFLP